jgi:hypothetical protein
MGSPKCSVGLNFAISTAVAVVTNAVTDGYGIVRQTSRAMFYTVPIIPLGA